MSTRLPRLQPVQVDDAQRVVVEQLLPIPRKATRRHGRTSTIDYLFEPAPEQLLNALLPVPCGGAGLCGRSLESSAAEHAARMTAMDSATRNASEMVDQLTLYMNKVRQAAITREIIEVVSGAQAV